MSMCDRMMLSACEDWVWGVSVPAVSDIAARTSGGRFVDVWVISSRRLLVRSSIQYLRYSILSEFRIRSAHRELLVAQRVHRTHARGLDGRRQPGDQSDEFQQQRRGHHREL